MGIWAAISQYVDVTTICLATASFILSYAVLNRFENEDLMLPPGPRGIFAPLEILRILLRNLPHRTLRDMSQRYGHVISFKAFGQTVVVLNDYESIKEAFVKYGAVFSGRPSLFIDKVTDKGKGIIATEGREWRRNRKLLVSSFRRLLGHAIDLDSCLTDEFKTIQKAFRHIALVQKSKSIISEPEDTCVNLPRSVRVMVGQNKPSIGSCSANCNHETGVTTGDMLEPVNPSGKIFYPNFLHADVDKARPSLMKTKPVNTRKKLETQSNGTRVRNIVENNIGYMHEGIGLSSVESCKTHWPSDCDNCDELANVKHALQRAACNVVCRFLFGKHCDFDTRMYCRMLIQMEAAFEFARNISILNFIPVLNVFPSFGFKTIIRATQTMHTFISVMLARHVSSSDEGGVQDVIDAYLQSNCGNDDRDKNAYMEEIQMLLSGVMVGGTMTTCLTLCWSLRFLAGHPDVQQEIFDELKREIAPGSVPVMADADNCRYTMAAITEIQRFAPVTPLGIVHSNTEHVHFRQFTIPKRSLVFANIWAAHFDANYFQEPELFRPGRFLDVNRKGVPGLLPFSVGRRSCPGEWLAKGELFVFLANTCLNFRLTMSEDATRSAEDEAMRSMTPQLDKIKICVRHQCS